MISDILFDAIADIRRYQRNEPHVYDADKAIIDTVVGKMHDLMTHFDSTLPD